MAFENNLCEIQKALDPMVVNDDSMKRVDNFAYLGNCIAADSDLQKEVSHRTGIASKALDAYIRRFPRTSICQ